jgi:hypothetical protein
MMGEMHSACKGSEKCVLNLFGKSEEINRSENLTVEGKIILK